MGRLNKIKRESVRFVVASSRAEYYDSVTSVLGQFRFKKNTLKAGGFITGRGGGRPGGVYRAERAAYSIGKEELHIEV